MRTFDEIRENCENGVVMMIMMMMGENGDGDAVGRKKREGDRKTERERVMLLRKRLLRSQSVACDVQAGAFKELAGLAHQENLPNG